MSVISSSIGQLPRSTGNPWGAVAPRATMGNTEYKLIPDQVSLSPSSPQAEVKAKDGGNMVPAHLENLARQSSLTAAGVAAQTSPLALLLLGDDQSSKENQAQKLAENLGLVHLNMGDLIRQEVASGSQLGQELKQSLDSGDRSPAVLLYELVARRVSQDDCKSSGFVLDAYPEDFKHHRAEALLEELEGLRMIRLADEDNCPNCIPVVESARAKGLYFEVDDEEDEQDTADVLEALVDNFQSTPIRLLAVE